MADDSRTLKLVLILVVAPFVLVCGIGIVAAVALPAFIGYVREAKIAEAETNVMAISSGLEAYYLMNREVPDLEPTPATPPCDKQLWPATADPRWADLGFSPADPLHYSYEIEVTGNRFTIRARGNLDCDSYFSSFERSGTVTPFAFDSTDITTIDELE